VTKIVQQQAMGFVVSFSEFFFRTLGAIFSGSRDFTEVKELPVLDVVKSMAWCGESLCLGIRREYVIMNTVTGATVDVFPCGRFAAPLVVSLNNDELLLGKVCCNSTAINILRLPLCFLYFLGCCIDDALCVD
jgi:hypothetical protein